MAVYISLHGRLNDIIASILVPKNENPFAKPSVDSRSLASRTLASRSLASWTLASRLLAFRTPASFGSRVFGSQVAGSQVSRSQASGSRVSKSLVPWGCFVDLYLGEFQATASTAFIDLKGQSIKAFSFKYCEGGRGGRPTAGYL